MINSKTVKNINEFVNDFIEKNPLSSSMSFYILHEEDNPKKKYWLDLSVEILEIAYLLFKEKSRKKIEIGIRIQLKAKKEKIGVNFSNEKELRQNYTLECPSLFLSRRKNINVKQKNLKRFYLDGYKKSPFIFLLSEGYWKKYDIDYRTVYFTRNFEK